MHGRISLKLMHALITTATLPLLLSGCGEDIVRVYDPIDYANGDEYAAFTSKFAAPAFSFEYPADYNLNSFSPMPPFLSTSVGLSDIECQRIDPFTIECPPDVEWDYKRVSIHVNQINEDFPKAKVTVDKMITDYEERVTWGWSADFKLLERNRVMVAGLEGWEVVFSNTLLPVDLDIVSRTREVTEVVRAVLFNYQGTVWEIKIRSDEGNTEQAKLDYEHILGTLRILE